MSNIAVVGDVAGGAEISTGQSFVTISGKRVIVLGDPVSSHGSGPHGSATMVEGSSWFTINGKAVCHSGHKASCGHAVSATGFAIST